MALRVLSAASDKKLCVLSDVKTRLGISGSGSDALLTGLIVGVSSAICSKIGRELARQQYQEDLAGNDRQKITLSRYPLDSDSTTTTIDDTAVTDYSVEHPENGVLWREGLWDSTAVIPGQDGEENVTVTYKAGYVLPNWISAWSNGMTPDAGDWVRASTPVKDFLFECTTAGTANSTEPTWPTTAGGTVTDGTVVWTARHALELPDDLEEAALLSVMSWYQGGLELPGNVKRERLGPMEMEYHAPDKSFGSALPRAAEFLLEPYVNRRVY